MSPVRALAGAFLDEGRFVMPKIRVAGASRPSPSPPLMADPLLLLCVALGVFGIVCFSHQLFNDGDTFWHLATGDWILRHGAVPRTDPFSYTVSGRAWTAQEWLTEILMAETWRGFGWAGLSALFGAAVAALAWILGSELKRKLPMLSCIAALALALGCTDQSWLARPHLLALPILAFWTVQLLRAREAGRAPPLWLLPVIILWANLHASFLIGIGLLGPFAVEAVLEGGDRRWRAARDWALFILAALACALITPQGVEGLIYPIRVSSMRTLQDINEWRSADFGRLGPLELTLLTALFVLVHRRVRIPLIRLLMLIGLVHLALHETRHQMVLAVVGVLLLAAPLGEALAGTGAAPFRPLVLAPRARAILLALLLVIGGGLLGARLWIPTRITDGPTHPVAALARVPAALRAQPVLNEYGMGGYLIFNHVRPFIDGRADMYGDDFFDAYVQAIKPDRPKLLAMLAKYRVRWTILDPQDGAVQMLDSMPGWKRLYADKSAVVQVKVGG
ncbi:MAG TPA: hypothetical protein VIJ94_01760 [Caulobacteraceae bacterium]